MLVLIAAVCAFYIKMFLQDRFTDEQPMFYRNGYDLCVMSLSTGLTAAAAEYFAPAPEKAKFGLFCGAAFLSVLATVFASRNSKFIKDYRKDQPEGMHSFITFAVGMALFIVNLFVLVKKS